MVHTPNAYTIVQERFIQESQDRISVNATSIYLNLMSNRWLGLRLENLGNLIILFASIFAVMAKDHLTSGQAGLSITTALEITGQVSNTFSNMAVAKLLSLQSSLSRKVQE